MQYDLSRRYHSNPNLFLASSFHFYLYNHLKIISLIDITVYKSDFVTKKHITLLSQNVV